MQEIQRDFQDAIESRIIQGGRQLGKSMSTHRRIVGQAMSMVDESTVQKPSKTNAEKNKKKKAQKKAKMSRKRNKKS